MPIKNRLEKFLFSLSSMLLATVAVMGIKISDDAKKMENIKNDLASGVFNDALSSNQGMISSTREKILSEVANSPASDVQQKVTTETLIPGKIVKEVVPSTSKKTSSKSSSSSLSSSSSSSSSKTTKTS